MNKLIIIGNGFDLSHDLKTSYKDFLLDYLKNIRKKLVQHEGYNDLLFEIGIPLGNYEDSIIDESVEVYEWFSDQINNTYHRKQHNISIHKYTEKSQIEIFDVSINSILFERLFRGLNYGWVDVENEYFNILLENKDNPFQLQKINDHLVYIKKLLMDYLARQVSKPNGNITKPFYVDYFLSDSPNQILFLNFNYTNTIEQYIEIINRGKIKPIMYVNYIHGDLSETHGSPIFGIGDEHHHMYEELKDQSVFSTIFKHSKSVEYMKAKNYQFLNFFLYAGDFIVEVYGHSCGLSDRTLLKHIFDKEYCKKIHIYHHGGIDDFWAKELELLRHFDNPQDFRDKLEPFSEGNSM